MGLRRTSILNGPVHSALIAGAIACVACAGGQGVEPGNPYLETTPSESAPARVGSASALPSDSAAPAGHSPSAPTGASDSSAPAEAGGWSRWPTLPDEQFALAERYAAGNGVPRDSDRAAYWACRAGLQRHAAALEWLEQRAQKGDTAARLWLGVALRKGKQPDQQRAAELFTQALAVIRPAAEKGNATAQYQLGVMLDVGYGVARNAVEARQWYERAGLQGHVRAQSDLAYLHSTGEGGPKDLEKAAQWWQRAAEKSEPTAQFKLAFCYLEGLGREKDPSQALRWFLAAAANGDAVSQFNAGLMLSRGEGVAKDLPAARAMYAKAVAQGEPLAQNNLALMHENGEGGPVNLTEAARLFRLSAESGNEKGSFNLGRLYRDGVGVPIDLELAKTWFKKAAKGNERARQALAQIEAFARCAKIAKTELFGVKIRCAAREQLRRAVARAGGTVRREDDAYWVDRYESARLLEGSSELLLSYTSGGEFARAEYTFPSHMDADQVTRIAEMVTSKYGRPRARKGDPGLGPVEYDWRLGDGLTLRVWRGWPDSTTYLEYVRPDAYAVVKREVAASQARQKAEKNKSQAHAF